MHDLLPLISPFLAGLFGVGLATAIAVPVLKSQMKDVKDRVVHLEKSQPLLITAAKCGELRGACVGERIRDVDGLSQTMQNNREQRRHEIDRIYDSMENKWKELNENIMKVGSRLENIAGDLGAVKATLELIKSRSV